MTEKENIRALEISIQEQLEFYILMRIRKHNEFWQSYIKINIDGKNTEKDLSEC